MPTIIKTLTLSLSNLSPSSVPGQAAGQRGDIPSEEGQRRQRGESARQPGEGVPGGGLQLRGGQGGLPRLLPHGELHVIPRTPPSFLKNPQLLLLFAPSWLWLLVPLFSFFVFFFLLFFFFFFFLYSSFSSPIS